MVLIGNGGSNHLLNVGEMQETVQTRLMLLVTDQQVMQFTAQAEKIIDFQIVDLIIDRMISDMESDLNSWGETKTEQLQSPVKSPDQN